MYSFNYLSKMKLSLKYYFLTGFKQLCKLGVHMIYRFVDYNLYKIISESKPCFTTLLCKYILSGTRLSNILYPNFV